MTSTGNQRRRTLRTKARLHKRTVVYNADKPRKDCNMKILPAEKRAIDLAAAYLGITRKQLLLEGFRLWVSRSGRHPPHKSSPRPVRYCRKRKVSKR